MTSHIHLEVNLSVVKLLLTTTLGRSITQYCVVSSFTYQREKQQKLVHH